MTNLTAVWWLLQPAQAGAQASPVFQLVPMALIFLVFYFLWFRPVRQKQKETEAMIENLKKGDQVITTSGLYGKIVKIDDPLVVEIADNVRIRIARQAVGGLQRTDRTNDEGK
ncbi:MAG: preprotein translocase subunit YajC [Acidobacteriota bacterium]